VVTEALELELREELDSEYELELDESLTNETDELLEAPPWESLPPQALNRAQQAIADKRTGIRMGVSKRRSL
jgi:hypothetical protein